jgi:arylsulfatase A-like enzyme
VRIRGKGLIGQMDFDGGTQETCRRMITAMDLQIGRVIETLSANGILGNTIVVFTSDNGGGRFADRGPRDRSQRAREYLDLGAVRAGLASGQQPYA